jgi:hypothetical protein
MKPSAAPTKICSTALAMMSAVCSDGSVPRRYGAIGRVSPTDSSALTVPGMFRELNGGAIISQAPVRAAPSRMASRLRDRTFAFIGTTPPAP